ncbi:leucyl aminopeptidase [Pseudonocardiaceae bacterium YIM PH 21723]|nr:leucyl aminopeptidase [Pseudonocardiaceae bacterium YIM PH 21723]
MTLSLTDTEAGAIAADAIIIGTVAGGDSVRLVAGSAAVDAIDAAYEGKLADLLGTLGATGAADEVVKLPTGGKLSAPILVAAGLGKPGAEDGVTAEQVRKASGAAVRSLNGLTKAVNTLAQLDLTAAAEGSLLGRYQFTSYRSEPGKPAVGAVELVVGDAKDAEAKSAVDRATAVAEAVATTRDFVNTPPNDLFPASFAAKAVELAEAAGLTTEVLDENALEAGGFGGILGVGGGSSRKPRLVRLTYTPKQSAKKVALVGKGITFDTGGISIKPASGMEEMTMDMAGAATMIATVVAAAKLQLDVAVTATVPMAENMPSSTAYRPGDVLSHYGGKTVEVVNTDAEGRLILADAIVRACEDEPDYLIEASTLTGAAVVALGTKTGAVMGSDELRDRIVARAGDAGESMWPMPLPEDIRADLDSRLADITNSLPHRWGGMLAAGLYLKEFVAEGVPWAHLDIAGPAYNSKGAYGYVTKGGTGVAVRTLLATLEDIATNG